MRGLPEQMCSTPRALPLLLVLALTSGCPVAFGSGDLRAPRETRPPAPASLAKLCGASEEASVRAALPDLPACGGTDALHYVPVRVQDHDVIFVAAVPADLSADIDLPIHAHVLVDGVALPDSSELAGQLVSALELLPQRVDLRGLDDAATWRVLVGAVLVHDPTLWSASSRVATSPQEDRELVRLAPMHAERLERSASGYVASIPAVRAWGLLAPDGSAGPGCAQLVQVTATLDNGQLQVTTEEPLPACR